MFSLFPTSLRPAGFLRRPTPIAALPVAALLVIAAGLVPRASAYPAAPYKGAVIMDAASGRFLYADNPNEVSPPASMTKLMTYAVLVDEMREGRISPATPVEVTSEDERVATHGDSTNVGLRRGERFTVDELTYALFIESANDAAHALAHADGGTVETFVERMNAKARQLGMSRSTFRTPNGFPVASHRIADGDLTTPRDFAVLCRYLLLNTDVLRYSSVQARIFGAGTRLRPFPMRNHNDLLGRVAGVDGLKTGFTSGAGFCLAATALRDGRRVIVVVMDSPDSRTRNLHVADLLRRGFESLPLNTPPFHRASGAGIDPALYPSRGTSPLTGAGRNAGPAELPPGTGVAGTGNPAQGSGSPVITYP